MKYGLTQEADIVGNLHKGAGNHVECTGDLHHGVMGGQRFELRIRGMKLPQLINYLYIL
jgi:hypothetical protein